MKLSTAIRKGCKLAPRKANGSFVVGENDNTDNGPVGARCALGAAGLILGTKSERSTVRKALGKKSVIVKVPVKFSYWLNQTSQVSDNSDGSLDNITEVDIDLQEFVINLNDDLGLPRYKIANILERMGF